MVGYILGLGDRHTCNVMIDRVSGKVLHIDFGDCFEVAMHREKFPEKIPFRLTRMLINAMEISGIEGTFRLTCESVMQMLRENKESILAVLEAFVYDPLINWRLLDKRTQRTGAAPAPVSNGPTVSKDAQATANTSSSDGASSAANGPSDMEEMRPQERKDDGNQGEAEGVHVFWRHSGLLCFVLTLRAVPIRMLRGKCSTNVLCSSLAGT